MYRFARWKLAHYFTVALLGVVTPTQDTMAARVPTSSDAALIEAVNSPGWSRLWITPKTEIQTLSHRIQESPNRAALVASGILRSSIEKRALHGNHIVRLLDEALTRAAANPLLIDIHQFEKIGHRLWQNSLQLERSAELEVISKASTQFVQDLVLGRAEAIGRSAGIAESVELLRFLERSGSQGEISLQWIGVLPEYEVAQRITHSRIIELASSDSIEILVDLYAQNTGSVDRFDLLTKIHSLDPELALKVAFERLYDFKPHLGSYEEIETEITFLQLHSAGTDLEDLYARLFELLRFAVTGEAAQAEATIYGALNRAGSLLQEQGRTIEFNWAQIEAATKPLCGVAGRVALGLYESELLSAEQARAGITYFAQSHCMRTPDLKSFLNSVLDLCEAATLRGDFQILSTCGTEFLDSLNARAEELSQSRRTAEALEVVWEASIRQALMLTAIPPEMPLQRPE